MRTRSLRPFAALVVLVGVGPLAAKTAPARVDSEEDEPVEMSPFLVNAPDSSAGRYTAFEATSADRTRVDIMDSVQNFSVITGELMEDVAGSRVVDAARYVAGVTDSSLPTSWERTNIRGFMGDGRTVDGFTYGSYPYYGVMNQDPAIFDRMEVVKGPSSILAPQPTSPGGTINLMTKKPQFGNFGLLNLQWGQFDANSALVDMNRVLNGKLAARLVASRRDYEHWWKGAYVESTTVMPEFTYQFSPSTKITAQFVYADWKAANYFGLPIDPSSGTTTPSHLLAGVPRDLDIYADDVVRTDEQHDLKLLLTTELWHGISMRLAADYHTVNLYVAQLNTGPSTGVSGVSGGNGGNYDPLTGIWNPGLQYEPAPPYASSPLTTQPTRIFRRSGTTLDSNPKQLQVQNDYAYIFENEMLKSTTLVGFTYKDAPEYHSESYNITGPNLNIDNYVDTPFTRNTLSSHRHHSSRFWQVYFSENLGLWKNRLILNFSGTEKKFDTRTQDMPTGAITGRSTSDFVPSYGAVLKPYKDNISLYYSHSEQSSPTGAVTGVEPSISTARQEEVGARFKGWAGKFFFTVAHYDIIHDNYAVANPGNLVVPTPSPLLPSLYTDRFAKGWEYELRASPNRNISIIGSYTHFTNRDPNNVEFRGVAEKAGSLLVSYTFGRESASKQGGFRIAVGADYVGERPGDTPAVAYTVASTPTNLIPNQPSFYLGARTLVNLTLAYDSKHHWALQLNVDNVLDEEYLMASNIRNGVFPGTPTNVRVSLRYRF